MALGIAAPVAAFAADSSTPQQTQDQKSDEGKGQERQDLKTRLDAAVKEGKLTQAEADAVIKAAEAGVLWPGGRQHGKWDGKWDGQWKGHWKGHWDGSKNNGTETPSK